MVFSNKYLAVLYASIGWCILETLNTPGFKVEAFHPETKFDTFGAGLEQPGSFMLLSVSDATVSFVTSRLGVDGSKVAFKSGFTAETAQVVYVKQAHEGILFPNAVANVAWKNNKVISFGSSFVRTNKIAPSTPSISVESIISKTEQVLEGKNNDYPAALEYLARPDGSVALAHVIQIQNEEAGSWYEAFVDAHSGEILTVTDFVSDATLSKVPSPPITKQTFPEGQEILVDPQDLLASPLGWHDDGTMKTNNTSGNNVVAFKGTQTNVTLQSADPFIFNYTYNDAIAPTEGTNIDAARTNAFYIINSVHDYAYRYGFTEAAFNFQTNNFGKGGKGNDRVLMSVQDASGTNSANFATPAESVRFLFKSDSLLTFFEIVVNPEPAECTYGHAYLWVRRDGSLENDIIVHEMTHGITNRMTGGGTGRFLQTTEAGGMGEGWSDAMAEWTEQKSETIVDYVLGQYVINNAAGIRKHPYSTNATINPLRYSSVAALNEVHNIGEVWANMLHNVYAALVAEHGWSSTAKTHPDGTEGNIVFLHLFVDALALQPCNSTFVYARDAWIQADVNRYGGANACILWKAFASCGLGVNAANFVDSTTLPPACV